MKNQSTKKGEIIKRIVTNFYLHKNVPDSGTIQTTLLLCNFRVERLLPSPSTRKYVRCDQSQLPGGVSSPQHISFASIRAPRVSEASAGSFESSTVPEIRLDG